MGRLAKVAMMFLLLGLLAACKGTSDGGAQTPMAEASTLAIRPEIRLVLGTVALEGDLAIDASQAAELLPLWKAYRALLNDAATAELEREALLSQIREMMRPEQVEAIDALSLSPEEQRALMAKLGVEMPAPGSVEAWPEAAATQMAQRGTTGGALPGAGGPAGVPPAGLVGMGPEGIQGVRMQASRASGEENTLRVGARGILLIDALIAYLEALAQGD